MSSFYKFNDGHIFDYQRHTKEIDKLRFAFQFDEVYPTRGEMERALENGEDNVYIGRYVLVRRQPGQEEVEETYPAVFGYDWQGTVWQKSRLSDGTISYVYVANLNTVNPRLTITADNPLKEEDYLSEDFDYENVSYFADDSDDITWKLHVPALWHLRLGDVEFNKLGFDKNKSNIISMDDNITHSYDQTKLKYWDRENQVLKTADDIYKINMLLPSIGNTVSNLWDLAYGTDVEKTQRGRYFFYDYSDYQLVPNVTKENFEENIGRLPRDNEYIEDEGKLWVWSGESGEWSEIKDSFLKGYDHTSPIWTARNKDIRWNSYDGLRGISKDNVDTKLRFSNYNFRENLESLAGSINSTHDLMGMIIRDYETLDNVENWDPSKIYYIDEEKKFYKKSEASKADIIKIDENPTNNYEQVTVLNLNGESLYREDWGEYPRFLEIGSINEDTSYPAYKKYVNYRKPSVKEHIAGSIYDEVEFAEEVISSNWEDIKPAWYQETDYVWKNDDGKAPVRPTQPYYHIQNPQKIESGKQVYIPGLYWAILWEKNGQNWKKKKALLCTSPYDSLAADIQSLFGVAATDENVRFYNKDAAKIEEATEGNVSVTGPTVSYSDDGYVAFNDLLAFKENKYYTLINDDTYILIDFYKRNNGWTTNENQRGSSIDQEDQWWIDNKASNLYILTEDNFERAGVVYALTADQNLWYYPVENDYVKETIWRLPVIQNQELRLSKITNKVPVSYDEIFEENKYFTRNDSQNPDFLVTDDFGDNLTIDAYKKKERYIYESTNPNFKPGDRYYGDPEDAENLGITLGVIDPDASKWVAEEIPGYSYDTGTMNGLILATNNALKKMQELERNIESAIPQIKNEVDNINNFNSIIIDYTSGSTGGALGQKIDANGRQDQLTLKSTNGIELIGDSDQKRITIGHVTGNGYKHVPKNETTDNGKVLKAGNTAGTIGWGTLAASDVGAAEVDHAHTITLTSGGTSSVNLVADTAYTLKIDDKNSLIFKTPANPTYTDNDEKVYQQLWSNFDGAESDTSYTSTIGRDHPILLSPWNGNGQYTMQVLKAPGKFSFNPLTNRMRIGDVYLKSYTAGDYNPLGTLEGNPFDGNPILNIEQYLAGDYTSTAINAAGLFWNGHRAVTSADSHGQTHSFQIDFNHETRAIEIWVDGGNASGGRPFVIFTQGS